MPAFYNKIRLQMINKLPFQFPLLICAPMVDQSELPFRMLTRKYGSNLCYTPMLHSKMLTTQKKYKQEHFTTCPQDRPLVAQICGHDPETMVQAAKMLENQVDAIDVNFGCPQGIARRGRYGSFLLEEPELVSKIVKALSESIKVPIFCKIRIRKSEEKTFDIVNRIVEAGCQLLTVHGRTKEQNKDRVGACNWAIIKKIKDSINIPVVANGGIETYDDALRCLKQTGVDGVMSAESLLENPALFSGKIYCLDSLALEYLELTQIYKGASTSCIRAHLFKILFKGLSQNVDLRERLTKANNINEFKEIAIQLKNRRAQVPLEEKLGWYRRYWGKCYVDPSSIQDSGEQKSKEVEDQQLVVQKNGDEQEGEKSGEAKQSF